MWGWCQRNVAFYGHARGHVSGPGVMGEPPAPLRSITSAAPENACCRALCSHTEAAFIETNSPSVGPLPSASHPSLSTQVGYLGAGCPEAGHRWAGTGKGSHPCQVSRNPEWF